MTQRSIFAGKNQTIIVKTAGSIIVRGHEGDMVTAETDEQRGLTLERRSASQIARARAAVGDHVLFDLRIKVPGFKEKEANEEVIEIQMGGGGHVFVPFESNLKVYSGRDIDVHGIKGRVDAYSARSLKLHNVYQLGNVSAGSTMDIDCQTVFGEQAEFKAGSDLRFHVHDLTSAHIRVRDLGGYWEARIGNGEKSIYLKSGGDVTLVTDQKVEPLPPNYVLGKIEKPA
jgi:hypothetical protein